MGMIEAVLPTMPAAGPAMGANQVAAVTQGLVTEGAVQGVAINSAAAGLLFGMLMTQLAAGMSQPAAGMSQPAAGKDADTKAPEGSESQIQPSADETSIIASLLPVFVSLQIEPQPTNPASTELPKAVSTGPTGPVSAVDATLTPLALATLADPMATIPSEHPALLPALSMDAGKQFEVAMLQNQMQVTAATPVGPEATTQLPLMPLLPTHDQGNSIHTILATIPTAGEGQKPSEPATTGNAGPALSPALPSNDKKVDQLQVGASSSVLIDATLTRKKDEDRDNLLNAVSETSAKVVGLAPIGSERLPAEFLAGPSSSPSPPTEAAVPVPKATMVTDASPPAMTSPRDTIHLQFAPSELGRLTLQVSVQSQQVQATVSLEHRGLGEFLTASQGTLDSALRQHGLRLEELHIETMGNPDLLGADAGRTGLLDHGHPRQDSPAFDREPLTRPGAESEVSITRADILDSLGSRHRINLFA
jgi:hypothetical protein